MLPHMFDQAAGLSQPAAVKKAVCGRELEHRLMEESPLLAADREHPPGRQVIDIGRRIRRVGKGDAVDELHQCVDRELRRAFRKHHYPDPFGRPRQVAFSFRIGGSPVTDYSMLPVPAIEGGHVHFH